MRGEVSVVMISNVPDRLVSGVKVFLRGAGLSEWRSITSVKGTPEFPIVLFEGVSSRDQADRLRNVVVLSEAVPIEGEILISQLIGSEVVDLSGRAWGRVVSVEANPAADLLVTDLSKYIPSVFIIDYLEGVVRIDPPEGLFDL